MKIKELCHDLQKDILLQVQLKIPKSHIYELISALYDYKTYASFCADAILIGEYEAPESTQKSQTNLLQRCQSLGYSEPHAKIIQGSLTSMIDQREIGVLSLTNLVSQYREVDPYYPEDYQLDYDRESVTPDFILALKSSAEERNLNAHYALALLLSPSEQEDDSTPNPHWYNQRVAGRVLAGAEKEFADTYEHYIKRQQEFEFHLREASKLGSSDAQFELALRFGEPDFFDSTKSDKCTFSDLLIFDIAENLGRHEDAKKWMELAAEDGDTGAMKLLVEKYGHDDPLSAWKWFYLAKSLGIDITQDHHVAINENGSPYDDDVGGPIFVGGEDGVTLPSLPESMMKDAYVQAEMLAEEIYPK